MLFNLLLLWPLCKEILSLGNTLRAPEAPLSPERMRPALSSQAAAPTVLQRRVSGCGAGMIAVEGAGEIPYHPGGSREAQRSFVSRALLEARWFEEDTMMRRYRFPTPAIRPAADPRFVEARYRFSRKNNRDRDSINLRHLPHPSQAFQSQQALSADNWLTCSLPRDLHQIINAQWLVTRSPVAIPVRSYILVDPDYRNGNAAVRECWLI